MCLKLQVDIFCHGLGSRKIRVNIFILLYVFYLTYDLFFGIQCLIFGNSVESKNVCESVIFQLTWLLFLALSSNWEQHFSIRLNWLGPPSPPNTSVILEETEMMDSVKNNRLVKCNIFFTSISLIFCREYFLSCPWAWQLSQIIIACGASLHQELRASFFSCSYYPYTRCWC